MAAKWVLRLYLVLAVRLVVPCVEAGDWQHCQNVSPLRCSVGDSRNGESKYRYDIGKYQSRWKPSSFDSYQGPFDNIYLYPTSMVCYDCAGNRSVSSSSVTGEVLSVTLRPSLLDTTVLVMVDHNVGTLTSGDTTAVSKLPCGSDCKLWFVNCNITTIEVGALAKLPQVKTLVIWQNNLETLRSGTFEGMEGVKELVLIENNMTCIEAGAFDGLPLLRFLYLVDNQILTMAPGMLRGLQLDWLDVSANSIWYIAPGVLQGALSARHVYIVENKLQSVSVGMFAELGNMHSLHLEYNEISWIADGAFHSNQRLAVVNLAGNKLTFLSGLWFKPAKLGKVNLKGNAIAVAYPGREDLAGWDIRIPYNPLRCTCANAGLYGHLWRRWKVTGRHPWHSGIFISTLCPAWSLTEKSPVHVNVSALPCPAPFVEIVNIEQNHVSQEYEAVGNVYWEDMPRVSWAFADGSEYSMNITYNTNTTTHANLTIGNLTVTVGTYLRGEGWTKCKKKDLAIRDPQKWKVCSNYLGKSSFKLWLEGTGPLAFRNTLCTASSESGFYTTSFEVPNNTHLTHSHTTQQPATTVLPLVITQHHTTTRQTTEPSLMISTSMSVERDNNAVWYISVAAIAGLLLVRKVVCKCFRCLRVKLCPTVRQDNAQQSHGVRAVTACSNWPLDSHDSLDGSVISPYAEGRFDDHDSLDGSEISPYAEGRLEDHDSLRDTDSSGSSDAVPYGQGALNTAYEERSSYENTNAENSNMSDQNCYQQHSSILPDPGAIQSSFYQQRSSYENTSTENSNVSDQNCYQHPSILPDPGATQSSAYQQHSSYENVSTENSNMSDQNCYQHPSILPDPGAIQSSFYQQRSSYENTSTENSNMSAIQIRLGLRMLSLTDRER
uniref:Uncharacterized protein n=1 Tax=Branchiostoma floridae TaxID=7739 RepID=C3Z8H7_BRAFL|eukprot:XP_002595071.1 hypothetical protein BRAFLDRAFT_90180 [Branchiostoma floridae]